MKDLKYSVLINKSSEQFAERGFECILSVILVLGSIFLLLLVPVAGVALSVIASSFLCVGIKKYLISVGNNKVIPIENIFLSYKLMVKAFCLKVAYMLLTFLWGIVFIIPGIITALNYSMSSFIMAENENLSSLECMAKSKKMVYGYRTQIFIIYLSYLFVSVVCVCVFAAIGIVIKNFTNAPIWVPVITMAVASLFIFVIFIIPYFELVITNAYLQIKNKQEKTQASQVVKKSTSTNKSKKTVTA